MCLPSNSSVLWVIARRKFKTDVSGLPVGPIFKGQTVQEFGQLETSVLNHFTSRNGPEDERIQFNRGGSLRSHKRKIGFAVPVNGSGNTEPQSEPLNWLRHAA